MATKILFSANDVTHGDELWVTDGTAAGTALVKDILPGGTPSQPGFYGFAALGNGEVVFDANDGTHGRELWVTDGTADGTALVKDINPGSSGSGPHYVTALGNGKAVFEANDATTSNELWVTDGTATGTALLADLGSRQYGYGDPPRQLTALGNGKAVFVNDDRIHGAELWVTDGTAAGTGLLKDIYPGNGIYSHPQGSFAGFFCPLGNGTAVFQARDQTHGTELWVTTAPPPAPR